MNNKYVWHDAKTDPPKKGGRYLTCQKLEISNYVHYEVLYYTLDARKLDSYGYVREKPKRGTHSWYFDDNEYGEVMCGAPDYWMYLPEYPEHNTHLEVAK